MTNVFVLRQESAALAHADELSILYECAEEL